MRPDRRYADTMRPDGRHAGRMRPDGQYAGRKEQPVARQDAPGQAAYEREGPAGETTVRSVLKGV